MFIKYSPILILLLLIAAMGCSGYLGKISGTATRKTGNQMPSPDAPPSQGIPLEGMVCFFALSNLKKATATGDNGFYAALGTPMVKEVRTDKNGRFHLNLKPGVYSVLIRKDSLFYSNITDMEGNINPVRVIKGEKLTLRLVGDWDAVY